MKTQELETLDLITKPRFAAMCLEPKKGLPEAESSAFSLSTRSARLVPRIKLPKDDTTSNQLGVDTLALNSRQEFVEDHTTPV